MSLPKGLDEISYVNSTPTVPKGCIRYWHVRQKGFSHNFCFQKSGGKLAFFQYSGLLGYFLDLHMCFIVGKCFPFALGVFVGATADVRK